MNTSTFLQGASLSAMMLFASTSVSSAAIINLTNDTINGIDPSLINVGGTDYSAGLFNGGGGIRRTIDSDDSGSGSGIFRNLYTVGETGHKTGEEFGYNRDGIMGTHVSNGFDPVITVNDLVLDTTGNFFVFVLDTNEPGNAAAKYISLDSFQLYVGGHIDNIATEPVANTKAELGNLGLNVYDIDGVEDNTVLMDYSLFSGSGEMDAYVFVPKSSFAGLDPNSLVYVFTEFGGYESESSGFGFAAGNEHVAMPYKAEENPPVTPFVLVPEPHSVMLVSLGGLMLALRRRRV